MRIFVSHKKIENMLSKSITERTLVIIEENKGIDIIEAVKMAIDQENKLISELIENKTDRSKKLRSDMCKNVFAIIHLKFALK